MYGLFVEHTLGDMTYWEGLTTELFMRVHMHRIATPTTREAPKVARRGQIKTEGVCCEIYGS